MLGASRLALLFLVLLGCGGTSPVVARVVQGTVIYGEVAPETYEHYVRAELAVASAVELPEVRPRPDSNARIALREGHPLLAYRLVERALVSAPATADEAVLRAEILHALGRRDERDAVIVEAVVNDLLDEVAGHTLLDRFGSPLANRFSGGNNPSARAESLKARGLSALASELALESDSTRQ